MSLPFPHLSPAQVENASFVPKMSSYVPTPLCNTDLLEPRTTALEHAVISLQEKVEKQQRRIQQLEEKLEKNTLKDGADAVVNGVMNVVNSSITQLNSLHDAENFKLRQKLNRMARENRSLVSNLHLALRRRDFGVTSKSLTLSQSVDSLLLEDSDKHTKTSIAPMDTKADETPVFSSDLMDFDFPSTSAVASDGLDETSKAPNSDMRKSPVGILVEDIGSISNDSKLYTSTVGLEAKPAQVSHAQPNTPAKFTNNPGHAPVSSRRQGSSVSNISAKKIARAPVSWDGRIKWTTTKAFSNSEEEMAALRMTYGGSGGIGAGLGLFQHGLVFNPDNDEEDVYRAVTITGIPHQVNMADVLKPVCGGPLYSVQLMRTAHLIGSHTAVVTFLYEDDARDFVQSTLVKDIVYFGNHAKVSLIRTPTFPISKTSKHYIFRQGHTRCLSISEVPKQNSVVDLLNVLLAWNNVFGNLLEGIRKVDSGATIHVRFHSIRSAGMAFSALKKHRDYKDCVVKFVPDPCDRPAM